MSSLCPENFLILVKYKHYSFSSVFYKVLTLETPFKKSKKDLQHGNKDMFPFCFKHFIQQIRKSYRTNNDQIQEM